jgi:hypothetical protein
VKVLKTFNLFPLRSEAGKRKADLREKFGAEPLLREEKTT